MIYNSKANNITHTLAVHRVSFWRGGFYEVTFLDGTGRKISMKRAFSKAALFTPLSVGHPEEGAIVSVLLEGPFEIGSQDPVANPFPT